MNAGNIMNFGVKVVILYGKGVDMEIASVGQAGIAVVKGVDNNSSYLVMNIIRMIVLMNHNNKRIIKSNL